MEKANFVLWNSIYSSKWCEYVVAYILKDGVSQSSFLRIDEIVIRVIGDDVNGSFGASDGVLAKPNCATGQRLAVVEPVGVVPPAIVDGIAGRLARCRWRRGI